jgi:ElaB/YqjD/DUF883 family membrane-anchored ribosome-binding protein
MICHAATIAGIKLANVQASGRFDSETYRHMSETNSEQSGDIAHGKLESGADHAKQALSAASEATKTVSETVKKQAHSAYEVSREHLTAAAKDVTDAAAAKYEELRGQARVVADDYKGRAQSAWSDATVKAHNFQSDAETYIRSYPLKSVGIAVGIGFVLGVIFRR